MLRSSQPVPPSSSPPVGESSFVSCRISKLTNLLLPLPPLQQVSPHLRFATLRSSLTHSSLFLPSTLSVLICVLPHFKAHQPAPLSSSPPAIQYSFVSCHVSTLPNLFLSRPLLRLVSLLL